VSRSLCLGSRSSSGQGPALLGHLCMLDCIWVALHKNYFKIPLLLLCHSDATRKRTSSFCICHDNISTSSFRATAMTTDAFTCTGLLYMGHQKYFHTRMRCVSGWKTEDISIPHSVLRFYLALAGWFLVWCFWAFRQ
jgi:hypothetical protein